jgi:hypothetical protein
MARQKSRFQGGAYDSVGEVLSFRRKKYLVFSAYVRSA